MYELHKNMNPKDKFGNWGYVLPEEEEVGVWDFKEEKGNLHGDEKQMFGKQMFAMPCRDSGIQNALWSPSPAEFPLLSHSALPGTDPVSKLF